MPKAAKGLTRSDWPGQNSKPPLTIKPNLASSQMGRRTRGPSCHGLYNLGRINPRFAFGGVF